MKITVTKAFIEEFKTKNGAWTKRQLELVGVRWPPKKGWQRKVIGLQITQEAGDEFKEISLRTYHTNNSISAIKTSDRIDILENQVKDLWEVINLLIDKLDRNKL